MEIKGQAMKSVLLLVLLFMTSCTYTITLVNTEGMASDVVDETSTAKADVSPTLSIPASLL